MRRALLIWASGAVIGACAVVDLCWRQAGNAVMREAIRADQPHWS